MEHLDIFECPVCHKKFTSLTGLSLHSNKSSHQLTDEQISMRKQKRLDYTKGDYICKICGKRFETRLGLHIHLKKHGITTDQDLLQYYINYENFEVPTCKICGRPAKFASWTVNGPSFRNTCGNKECVLAYNSFVQKEVYAKHPEKREERRLSRVNYLKNKENFVNTAWGKRAAGQLSFIEKWFYEKVILEYNLDKIYNIVNEFEFDGYSLDFAFVDLQLDVELDGKTHFINDKRIEHDAVRDRYVKSKGWKVYRITYKDIHDNQEKTISDFLNFIKTL